MTKIALKLIFLFYLLSSLLLYSQDLIKGKVIDSETNLPLAHTLITNLENNEVLSSDISGQFVLKSQGRYTFKREGYQPKTLNITSFDYQIIQLNIKTSELNEVIVTANQIPKALKSTTSTIEVLSRKDIDRGNSTDISQTLNRAPGIFVQSGALNTNRFTIRGIGSRNLYGTSNIRAYFKDIPLTNGSGETNIDDFELGSLARIEVIKGAASSIYGAGLGGTIHLTPRNAYLNQSSINSELTLGSFGLTKGTVNLNHGTTKNSYRAIYSNTKSDGYRDNNTYNRQTFTLSTNHYFNEKNEISLLLGYVDLMAYIPSSLNEDTYLNNPTAADFTWGKAKGYEDAKRGIFGLTWDHKYTDNLKQITSVFTSFIKAYEPRPFNILTENTFAYGIRSRLLGKTKLLDQPLNYTVGLEFFKDRYISKTFENLYQDFPDGTGSVEGSILSNFKENRYYYNLFFETNYELSQKMNLVLGINFNKTSYDLKDNFPVSDSNPDQSGDYKFDGILSPKLGLSYAVSKYINIYTSISQGFSPISLAETLLPDGQINTELKPETGWNYEIGTRGTAFNNKLQFKLAMYRLDVKNLVVSKRVSTDQYIGINAGQTQHDGLELEFKYNWLNHQSIQLSSFINYTLNDFTFKEFIDGDDNFSDNDLTGVPSDIFNAGIDITSKFGIYGNINFQHVGSQPITDSNSLYSDSYNLTNLKIGYKTELVKKMTLNLYVGLDNLFDKAYASQILINASGFGGRAPRYYYPGHPINFYTGLNINYAL